MTDAPAPCDGDRFARSRAYRAHAVDHLAFGVSSTPRATQAPCPVVISHAEGVRLTDIDGNRYIDYALGYGPLILGHSPRPVIEAVQAEMARGLRTAAIHAGEAELAGLIAATVPCAEVSAFVSTGSEATHLALRIARAATGRVKAVKFRANYHGWFDSLSVAGSVRDDGPNVIGQDPAAAASLTLLDWGDADAVETALDSSYAAVIVEPAAINAGCFAPPQGFLERLRAATRRHGVMLIFDEVITGYRLALGGAQARYGVTPDLCTLGKALGGGLPIGAVAGSRAAMAPLSEGRLMHRGTFNGNPLSVAASIACVTELAATSATLYPRMERFAAELAAHLNHEAARAGLPLCARQVGAAAQIFAGVTAMDKIGDLAGANPGATLAFTAELLRAGVFTLPRGLMYLSAAHTEGDIAETKAAMSVAIARCAAPLTRSRQP